MAREALIVKSNDLAGAEVRTGALEIKAEPGICLISCSCIVTFSVAIGILKIAVGAFSSEILRTVF